MTFKYNFFFLLPGGGLMQLLDLYCIKEIWVWIECIEEEMLILPTSRRLSTSVDVAVVLPNINIYTLYQNLFTKLSFHSGFWIWQKLCCLPNEWRTVAFKC